MPKATARVSARSLTKAKPASKLRRAPNVVKKHRPSPARTSSSRKPLPAALLREAAEVAAASPVLEAVRAHRSAHQRFGRAVDATDDVVASRRGALSPAPTRPNGMRPGRQRRGRFDGWCAQTDDGRGSSCADRILSELLSRPGLG